MSVIDKIAAAIMPPESDEDRATARRNAEALAGPGDWLAAALDHHRQIEAAFAAALSGATADARTTSLKRLALVLTGHANAEEAVLYPAMADEGEKGGATMAYQEQAMAKFQMAKLELLDPMSKEWTEKLEHIQGAVQHHVFEEEGKWFPTLQQRLLPHERNHVTARFIEEFDRYIGQDASGAQHGGAGMQPAPIGAADF